MTVLTRRSLLGGIGALLAAPAIVRAGSLMAVKVWADDPLRLGGFEIYADAATNSWWVPQQRYTGPISREMMMSSIRDLMRKSPNPEKMYLVNPELLNLLDE